MPGAASTGFFGGNLRRVFGAGSEGEEAVFRGFIGAFGSAGRPAGLWRFVNE